jgi:hypothetical protein
MMTPEDKVHASQIFIKLHEEGCTTPYATSMELFYMDKIVEKLSHIAENSDKLHKILNMMDSRILGLQERMTGMEEAIVSKLQGINHQVSGD